MKDYHGQISSIQKIQLDEIIAERLKSIIDGQQFQKIISFSKNKFGVGFSFQTARKISEKFESILKNSNNDNMAIANQ